ncbi:DUF413 domain-containing protein [Oceanicoccus sp. KOV_DT_Chl]|uniref:DUF413 domain-containing protein n=1 Tax=Oceanicoccus sp. KOV_DT_Chl TaxID=1904639 RepID=UPI000C7AA0C0|nr:DUF413 domain-containing protein [Oceanicoccus sp. KOV_DT_Chl]
MEVKGFEVTATFYNDAKFPRGFKKSGEFTIGESDLLHKYGQAMQALHNGSRKPVTDDEKNFVAACKGSKEAESPLEKVWLKYQLKIGKKVIINAFGSNTPVVKDSNDDDSDDDDLITELDEDLELED